MKTLAFLMALAWFFPSLHWFRTQPVDEAFVRAIIIAITLLVIYGLIWAIAKPFRKPPATPQT